ncbi:T9SS type B sorting domain-containing protein [Flavobacterium sp. GA093]|uniref:T9SS type B sorting domain-containing protein n=1 Tax=Flavobacterium hydrocarbonoxydans TaxID=2683249 RepID=A0A6I4NVK7_9FLAO|nr:gliding motility-associated C-terminal domain-containing protein [Flavobacterium hydrocarbonoxydans]MWB96495.1 T9SS type B sorting domain-containing protein [Flavobacterium hydrocarbonoxydans]
MVKNYFNFLQIIVFFLLLPLNSIAQCAGEDSDVVTVCDIPNLSSQTISLFSALKGTPVAGGVWTDDDRSGGLDPVTGVLNAHQIFESKIYHYTYTVEGCVDNSATVTVIIGGYSGVTSPNVSVCTSIINFNLFQAFDGVFLSPQTNGYWHNDTTGEFVGSSVRVKELRGTYQFTYTMPAIGSCAQVTSTAKVTVFRAPEPGTPAILLLCGSDGLSSYTNFDLYSLLSGQDPGGTWSDPLNSGEISSETDHNVNLEKLFETYGESDFTFTYLVRSTNPSICPDDSATVLIRIEKKLDFTGATLVVDQDICEPDIPTATYTATLTRGPEVIPNGIYEVTYAVSGANSGSETITANFINGVITFPIDSKYFDRVGDYSITILNIEAETSQTCQNIIDNLTDDLHIYPTPVLDDALVTPTTTCQNESSLVTISNAIHLADGTYEIIYRIRGDNTANNQTAIVVFTGGTASFTIPGTLNANDGSSIITITRITHTVTKCTNTVPADVNGDILINSLPDVTNLVVNVESVCLGEAVTVALSGLGTLKDITISYILSGSLPATNLTTTLEVEGGKASFTIPSGIFPSDGSYTFTMSNIINNVTTCAIDLTNVTDTFLLHPIPLAPIAGNLDFCKVDGATVANLVPNGTQYKWYNSSALTTPLEDTYVLKSENYYLTQTSAEGCTSPASMITVVINDSPAPVLDPDGPNFCALENPTILDLSNKTNVASTVVWYDAQTNGNLLPASTKLIDNMTYYGFDFPSTTACISEDNIEVTVALTDCDEEQYDFFIPDGFSPNGDNVNDTFRIPDIEFLFPDYTIEIFNRYGNIMFKGNKNIPNWDGRSSEGGSFGDGIAPNGVYFYVVYFNKDNKPARQGRLYLNR